MSNETGKSQAFGDIFEKVTDFLSPDEGLDKTRDALKEIKGELETGESYLNKAIEGLKNDLNEVGIQGDAQTVHIEAFRKQWQEANFENRTLEALASNEHTQLEGFINLENFSALSKAIATSAGEQDFMDGLSNKLISYFPSLEGFDVKGTLAGVLGIKAGDSIWSALFGSKKEGSKEEEAKKEEATAENTEAKEAPIVARTPEQEETFQGEVANYLKEIESSSLDLPALVKFETLFEHKEVHNEKAQNEAVVLYLKKLSPQFEERGLVRIIPERMDSGGHTISSSLVFKKGGQEFAYKLSKYNDMFKMSKDGQAGVPFDGSPEDFLNKMDSSIELPSI